MPKQATIHIKVQLRKGSVEEHSCEHFEIKENGVLYIYERWELHPYGCNSRLQTAYAPGFWECVEEVPANGE